MSRARRSTCLAAAALLCAVGVPALAQDLPFGDDDAGGKVTIGEATVDRASVAPGTRVRVRLPLTIVPGWHVYSVTEEMGLPTEMKVETWPEGLSLGAPTSITPAPEEFGPEGFEQSVHSGDIVVALDVAVADDAAPGPRTLTGTIRWMACDEGSCLPPDEAGWSVSFDVTERPKARIGTVAVVPDVAAPGDSIEVRIPVTLDEGWHIYGLGHEGSPTTVTVGAWPAGLSGGAVTESPAAVEHDSSGATELIHEGEVTFSLTVDVAPDAEPGTRTLRGVVGWMTCDAAMCNPPEEVPFEVQVVVGDAAAGGVSISLILEAIGVALLTLVTPCVFPMLPITVSFFTKQKGAVLPRALVYGSGWVFTIVVIGLIFASLLDGMARTSWFNFGVAALFIVLALSLFGMFDLRLPGFLSDWSTKRSAAGGYVGAFFMAVTLALTSFSCSMPFLGIMFRRFDGGDYVVALVALTVYSMTLALPFMVCSMFPAALSALPRAGSWMNAVKVTMGFVELGFAFKFLRTADLSLGWGVLPAEFVLAIWVACCLAASLYLFGYLVLPHDTKADSIGVVRMLFAIMFLTFGVYLVPSVFGRALPVDVEGFIQRGPEESWTIETLRAGGGGGGSEGAETASVIPWVKNDWDGALARAAEKKRPLLFDFTAVG